MLELTRLGTTTWLLGHGTLDIYTILSPVGWIYICSIGISMTGPGREVMYNLIKKLLLLLPILILLWVDPYL